MTMDGAARRPGLRGLAAAGGAVVAIALGAVAWHKVLRDQFVPRNFGPVVEGRIYRSGQLSRRMLEKVVADHGIRTIVDLSVSSPPREETERERAASSALGVERHEFSLGGDGTGDPEAYGRALALMADPAHQPLLVHCAAGAQRTGVAVMLYRHVVEDQPIADANRESFRFKRDEDDWKALAYLAEHLDEIRAAYERARAAGGAGAEPAGQGDAGP